MHQQLMQWFDELHAQYGPQGWWPVCFGRSKKPRYHHCALKLTQRQQFEIAVGAVLTQNTAWSNVRLALDNLHHAGVWMPDDLRALPLRELEQLIQPARYFRQKAKKLQLLAAAWSAAARRKRQPGAPLMTRVELLELWGIGEETADDIMLYAFRMPIFIIDAYTRRFLASRGIRCGTYHQCQRLFMDNLPPDFSLFEEFHALLVAWGQDHQRRAATRT